MTKKEIIQALSSRGYSLAEYQCKGMYDIFFKQIKVGYLYNSPSKGYASLQLVEDMQPKRIESVTDFWWYLP